MSGGRSYVLMILTQENTAGRSDHKSNQREVLRRNVIKLERFVIPKPRSGCGNPSLKGYYGLPRTFGARNDTLDLMILRSSASLFCATPTPSPFGGGCRRSATERVPCENLAPTDSVRHLSKHDQSDISNRYYTSILLLPSVLFIEKS